MKRPARQPSGNSGELSSQGILDNSPTPYGLHHDDPLMEGDVCWLAVKVDDPGNEYTFAAAHPVGHPGKRFLIDRDCLQSLALFRERGPSHTGDTDMTTPPFTTRIETASFAELQADAALCRKVLSTGYVNGYPLDADTEAEWREWLSDFEGEIETRTEWATNVNTLFSAKSTPAEKAAAGEVVERHVAAQNREAA